MITFHYYPMFFILHIKPFSLYFFYNWHLLIATCMNANSVWLIYKLKWLLIYLLQKYQLQYHFFQFTNWNLLSYLSKNVTCDFLSYVQLCYTNTWAVWFALTSRTSFIKEHKAFKSLKDWGSIRFFILLFLSKLSKSKISICWLPLCMLCKLIENEFHLLLNFYNIYKNTDINKCLQ